jgi:hypothetical protein
MKNKIQLLIVTMLITGCAASTKTWYNPSVTQQQAQTDWNQCEYDASKGSYTPMGAFDSPISSGIQEGFQKISLMSKCMTARGYYLTEQENINRSAPPIYETTSIYNPEEVSWFNQEGYGTIVGNAFIRKQDGGIVSCAGQPVLLFPSGSYADERIEYLYQSLESGHNNTRNIDKADPKYAENGSQTVCDVDGRFKFQSLPAGSYYVISTVWWGDPIQGGAQMMKRVSIIGDETKEITISK